MRTLEWSPLFSGSWDIQKGWVGFVCTLRVNVRVLLDSCSKSVCSPSVSRTSLTEGKHQPAQIQDEVPGGSQERTLYTPRDSGPSSVTPCATSVFRSCEVAC